MALNIAYVTSRFPVLTETFVAREIEEAVNSGYTITICHLRPHWRYDEPPGLSGGNARILKWNWNPLSLLLSNVRMFFRRRSTFLECMRDIWGAIGTTSRLHHMLYILCISAWLADRMRDEQVEFIHAHFLRTEAVGAMWIARFLDVPFSVTEHTVVLYAARTLALSAMRNAQFLVADTQQVYDMLLEMSGKGSDSIHLIPNGVSLREFPAKRGGVRIEHDSPMILAVGRLNDKKGFDVLIEACAILRDRAIPFRCHIVGDGEERHQLEELCHKRKLHHCVSIMGYLPFDMLKSEYEQASVFVMPSKQSKSGTDGLPTVVIEALAMGIPVVATKWAGIPDIIRNGKTGLLVEPNDCKSLADRLQLVLEDHEFREKVAKSGRALVEQNYDLSRNFKQLASLWQQRQTTPE